MTDYRKAVLQGEIMMLLHDIGKLHWRFVGSATYQDEYGWDLSSLHTFGFLCDVTPKETTIVFTEGVSNKERNKIIKAHYENIFSAYQDDLKNKKNLPTLQIMLMQEIEHLVVAKSLELYCDEEWPVLEVLKEECGPLPLALNGAGEIEGLPMLLTGRRYTKRGAGMSMDVADAAYRFGWKGKDQDIRIALALPRCAMRHA